MKAVAIAIVVFALCVIAVGVGALALRDPEQKALTRELHRTNCVLHAIAQKTPNAVTECEDNGGWGATGFEP